ncbi:MAG: VCBS repeat-containing protein [Nannocystaceae bacterium]
MHRIGPQGQLRAGAVCRLAAALAAALVGACVDAEPGCSEHAGVLCEARGDYLSQEVLVEDGVRLDVDGDGVLEYALVSSRARGLVLVEEDGSSRRLPLDPAPIRVAVAALDDDGIDDLVLAAQVEVIHRLRGRGDGSFDALEPLEVGRDAVIRALAAGDLDGDGRSEVVVACDGAVVVAAAPGEAPRELSFDGVAADLRLADLDGDGDLDVAVVDVEASALVVLLGDGAGGLTRAGSQQVPPAPQDLALADVDGDGAIDAVGRSQITGALWLAKGDGAGGFAAAGPLEGGGAGSFARGLVVASPSPTGLWSVVAPHRGPWELLVEEFGLRAWIFGDDAADVASADWPVDVSEEGFAVVTPELVGGDGFVAPLTFQRGLVPVSVAATALGDALHVPSPLLAADVDGDGFVDLLGYDASECALSVARGGPEGFTAGSAGPALTLCPGWLQSADVNGDGLVDVIAYDTRSIEVALGRGGGAFEVRPALDLGDIDAPPVVVPGDAPRVVVAGDGVKVVALDDAETLVEVAPLADEEDVRRMYAADVDGDGDSDLVVFARHIFTATRVYLREGDGFTAAPEFDFLDLPYAVFRENVEIDLVVGDLDGDARAEAIVLGEGGVGVFRDLDAGAPILAQTTLFAGDAPAVDVSAVGRGRPELADLDGDGRLDLVHIEASGRALLVRGEGEGLASAAQRLHLGAPRDVAVTPPDGDGRSDLLVLRGPELARYSARDVALPATGSPVALPRMRSPTASADAFGDFDGDGEVDVALLAEDMLTVVWGSDDLGRATTVPLPQVVPRGAVALDLDGDGRDELAVSTDSRVLVLRREADDAWTVEAELQGRGYHEFGPVEVADVDGDGLRDLVVAGHPGILSTPFAIEIAYGLAEGPLRFAEPASIFEAPLVDRGSYHSLDGAYVGLRIGDLDGDGLPELLLDGSGDGDIHLLWNEGGRRFTPTPLAGTSALIVGPGELAVVRDGQLERRLVHGRVVGAPARVGEVSLLKLVDVADCTGDGRPDLLLEHPLLEASLWAGVSGSFVAAWRLRGQKLRCADVDGDGVVDLLSVSRRGIISYTSGARP